VKLPTCKPDYCHKCGKCRAAVEDLNTRISKLEAIFDRISKTRQATHPANLPKQ